MAKVLGYGAGPATVLIKGARNPTSKCDAPAPFTECDAAISRGSVVVDHQLRVRDALAPGPADAGQAIWDRCCRHYVAGDDDESSLELADPRRPGVHRDHKSLTPHAAPCRFGDRRCPAF